MSAFVRRSTSLLSALLIAGSVLPTAATASAEVKELRVAFGFGLTYLPIMVADAQGYFAEQAKKADVGDLTV
jgi:ABC-type nitrate/sulfonate/bicarbonate transport system substrate-binding protein